MDTTGASSSADARETTPLPLLQPAAPLTACRALAHGHPASLLCARPQTPPHACPRPPSPRSPEVAAATHSLEAAAAALAYVRSNTETAETELYRFWYAARERHLRLHKLGV